MNACDGELGRGLLILIRKFLLCFVAISHLLPLPQNVAGSPASVLGGDFSDSDASSSSFVLDGKKSITNYHREGSERSIGGDGAEESLSPAAVAMATVAKKKSGIFDHDYDEEDDGLDAESLAVPKSDEESNRTKDSNKSKTPRNRDKLSSIHQTPEKESRNSRRRRPRRSPSPSYSTWGGYGAPKLQRLVPWQSLVPNTASAANHFDSSNAKNLDLRQGVILLNRMVSASGGSPGGDCGEFGSCAENALIIAQMEREIQIRRERLREADMGQRLLQQQPQQQQQQQQLAVVGNRMMVSPYYKAQRWRRQGQQQQQRSQFLPSAPSNRKKKSSGTEVKKVDNEIVGSPHEEHTGGNDEEQADLETPQIQTMKSSSEEIPDDGDDEDQVDDNADTTVAKLEAEDGGEGKVREQEADGTRDELKEFEQVTS